jgi:hypothetical protein
VVGGSRPHSPNPRATQRHPPSPATPQPSPHRRSQVLPTRLPLGRDGWRGVRGPLWPRASVGGGAVWSCLSWTWSVVELMRVSPVAGDAVRGPALQISPVVGVLVSRPACFWQDLVWDDCRGSTGPTLGGSEPTGPRCHTIPSGPPSPAASLDGAPGRHNTRPARG